MRLIIKEYLSSLKERGELDALLPDLLSQMGLRVFSRPGRGTRQYGVDIAAVGKIEDETEKVFLLSVKSGNLGRQDWDSESPQSLRPSLNEILDVYIPTHLPSQYKELPIAICICLGGDIEESVRLNISQFENTKTTENVSIVEWDGDKIAAWVEAYFLQEHLLPEGARPALRKSLAMIDEPQSSFNHFSSLVSRLTQNENATDVQVLTSLRQINICLWILFSWARDADNLESTYLAAERTLLYAWQVAKGYLPQESKIPTAIRSTYNSIFTTYQFVTRSYFTKIHPHVSKKHGLSVAVRSSKIDINLKLFEVLPRLAISGLWVQWQLNKAHDSQGETSQYEHEKRVISNSIKDLVSNNPTLLSPACDDQAIDIALAVFFLSLGEGNESNIITWLSELLFRVVFLYQTHGMYPKVYSDYAALLEKPERRDEAYREEATAGSFLYPLIGLWAALLENEELYRKVQEAKAENMQHCNFQFWYPDITTEDHLFLNDELHGVTFSHVPIEQVANDFLRAVWGECEQTESFSDLSCIKLGMWPILLVACRHYRLPPPIHFTLSYRDPDDGSPEKSAAIISDQKDKSGREGLQK